MKKSKQSRLRATCLPLVCNHQSGFITSSYYCTCWNRNKTLIFFERLSVGRYCQGNIIMITITSRYKFEKWQCGAVTVTSEFMLHTIIRVGTILLFGIKTTCAKFHQKIEIWKGCPKRFNIRFTLTRLEQFSVLLF